MGCNKRGAMATFFFSVIATAPQKRLAIKTFVSAYSPGIVREAALRELRDKAYVDFRVDPLSRLTEWRLTPSGHALAQPL